MFSSKKSAELPGDGSTEAVLHHLAIEYMRDKRIARRWKIAFWLFIIVYLLVALLIAVGDGVKSEKEEHTAVVELEGVISNEYGVGSDEINRNLRNAFAAEKSKAVILMINSPGGSPVQSANINAEIIHLKAKYPEKPLYVVMSDVAASGGYYVAVAADKIFANHSSIVGSIGVRIDSFGLVEAAKKLGIENRTFTAGENKDFLSSFEPINANHEAHARELLQQIHQHFIDAVKTGRGDRLAEDDTLFSGLFWTGKEAKKLGLIDDFGSVISVARDEVGVEKLIYYKRKLDFFERLSEELGTGITKAMLSLMNNRVQLSQ